MNWLLQHAKPVLLLVRLFLEKHVVDEKAGPQQGRLRSHVQIHGKAKI